MFWEVVLFILMVFVAGYFSTIPFINAFSLFFFVPMVLLFGVKWFLPFDWTLNYWDYVVIMVLFRTASIRTRNKESE
jgi:hypothetical protein